MILLLSLLLAFSPMTNAQTESVIASGSGVGENPEIVDYKGLQKYLSQFGDKTIVLNFWATWCAPCVKELPYFEQATEHFDSDDVVVVLVSLDFSRQIKTRLIPFLERHQLKSYVIVLDDPDANSWIDEVSPDWSGAIPATLIRRNNKESFYEKSFHSFDDLKKIIQLFLDS